MIRQLLLETFPEDGSKPYLDHKWVSRDIDGQRLNRLTVSWRLDGATSVYNALPWKDAIGTIVVEHHPNISTEPGFMFVESVHVAKEWRRKGLGSKLYQEASRIAKEHGYKGIASDSKGRSNDASAVWPKLGHRQSGDWSLLESLLDRRPVIISLEGIYEGEDQELTDSYGDFAEECKGLYGRNQDPALGHVVGSDVVSVLWASPHGHISYAVHPDYQRNGLAVELVKAYITEYGDHLEEITAEAINDHSASVLKKLGFVPYHQGSGSTVYNLPLNTDDA